MNLIDFNDRKWVYHRDLMITDGKCISFHILLWEI